MPSHCVQLRSHCSRQEFVAVLALHYLTHRASLLMTMISESKPRAASHMHACWSSPEEPSVKSLTQRTVARPITAPSDGTIALLRTLSGGVWMRFELGTTDRGTRVAGSKRNTSWWVTNRRIPGREQSLEYGAARSAIALTTGSPTSLSPATLKMQARSDACIKLSDRWQYNVISNVRDHL